MLGAVWQEEVERQLKFQSIDGLVGGLIDIIIEYSDKIGSFLFYSSFVRGPD